MAQGFTSNLPIPLSIARGGTGVTSSNPILQQVRTVVTSSATGTTTIPIDDTIPQNTEGDQYMSLAITPKSSTSILRIDVNIFCSVNSTAAWIISALFQDSTANALAAGTMFATTVATGGDSISFSYYMTSGTTSSTTFKVRVGSNTGATVTFNGNAGARLLGGVMCSSIYITEYSS